MVSIVSISWYVITNARAVRSQEVPPLTVQYSSQKMKDIHIRTKLKVYQIDPDRMFTHWLSSFALGRRRWSRWIRGLLAKKGKKGRQTQKRTTLLLGTYSRNINVLFKHVLQQKLKWRVDHSLYIFPVYLVVNYDIIHTNSYNPWRRPFFKDKILRHV